MAFLAVLLLFGSTVVDLGYRDRGQDRSSAPQAGGVTSLAAGQPTSGGEGAWHAADAAPDRADAAPDRADEDAGSTGQVPLADAPFGRLGVGQAARAGVWQSGLAQLIARIMSPPPPASVARALELESEYRWLASAQLPSGALTMAPGDARIVPYFANFAAMALLRWDAEPVLRYMEWYISRLNGPDRFGLDGTIYDHHWQDGREASLFDYDSADSYAATFLYLVARYVFSTGDVGFVARNLPALTRVASVCLALQDPEDGLVWAKPDRRYKFLMDNAEVQLGLEAWAEALRTIGLWSEAQPYAEAASRIRAAVEAELWDEDGGTYSWGKTPRGTRAVRRRWYPDTVCQLYPAVFGLIDPHGERNQALLDRLEKLYPRWASMGHGDQFPWTLVAYAFAIGGRPEGAAGFIEAARARYTGNGRPWTWYNLESAFFIDVLLELERPGQSLPARR
jgi:hypothetical protein